MNMLRIPVFLVLLFCQIQLAIAQENEPTPGPAWGITFDLEEHFRGEELPRMVHLEVDDSGRYLASYQLISDNPETASLHVKEGVLEEAMATYINDWLAIIRYGNIPADGVLKLGYGSSLVPGWQGDLSIKQNGSSVKLQFNSLRSTEGQRPTVYNQLVTFIFDLKRFTLSQFGLNRKRAVKPED